MERAYVAFGTRDQIILRDAITGTLFHPEEAVN